MEQFIGKVVSRIEDTYQSGECGDGMLVFHDFEIEFDDGSKIVITGDFNILTK